MSNLLVHCLGCRRNFPINLSKHRNRDYRFCPFCRTQVTVDVGTFIPSTNWFEVKIFRAIRKIIIRRGKTMKPERFTLREREMISTHEDKAINIRKSLFKKHSEGEN